VMVTYLDGDPDRPVVTGVVPNARQKVPYGLPGNKTKSVIRTNSHKSTGFNEMSFEDQTGKEELFVHAQKDMAIHVLNDRVKRVDANQVESIGANKNVDVAQNLQEKIGGSQNISVGGSGAPLMAVLGGIAAAGGKDSLNGSAAVNNELVNQFANSVAAVGAASELAALGANSAFNEAGGHRAEAGAQQTAAGSKIGALLSKLMPVSGIVNSVIEKFRSDTIGLARTEQIGLYKNTSVGHTMTLNIGEEFIIKCGDSKMMMDKKGNVTIVGTKFNFAASGHVQINGKVIDLN
jgi:type VI secretion system secreted protein VgrG